jgi:hypothetical protein
MAHFAELDNNNKVLRVIVVRNEDILNKDGIEEEKKGIDFCINLFGGNWIQTSFSGKFRKRLAGIGDTYDQTIDGFIAPKPFNSWVLNEENCEWEAPVSRPEDENLYHWNESTLSWDLVE